MSTEALRGSGADLLLIRRPGRRHRDSVTALALLQWPGHARPRSTR